MCGNAAAVREMNAPGGPPWLCREHLPNMLAKSKTYSMLCASRKMLTANAEEPRSCRSPMR